MLIVVAVIVTLSGTFFKDINNFASDRREIYTVYPALINNVSNVGSVVGSTANTKLALGLLSPTFSSIKNHGKNIVSAIVASFLVFTVLALISLAVNNTWSLESVVDFLTIIWISNIIAVFAIVILSYEVAIITFKRGLNPENFGIPIETSLATIITSAAILVALFAI
jgi:mgtE-like transporter